MIQKMYFGYSGGNAQNTQEEQELPYGWKLTGTRSFRTMTEEPHPPVGSSMLQKINDTSNSRRIELIQTFCFLAHRKLAVFFVGQYLPPELRNESQY